MNDMISTSNMCSFYPRLLPLIAGLAIIAILSNCTVLEREGYTGSSVNTDSANSTTNERIFGRISKDPVEDWNRVTRLENEVISRFDFLDENIGFAINNGNIYTTYDGGESWIKIKIDFARDEKIVALRFTSEKNGWCVVETIKDETEKNAGFVVYRTHDGGRTWSVSLVQQSAIYLDSAFQHERAWIAGSLQPNPYSRETKPLVLRFENKTGEWTNIASSFNSMTFDEGQTLGSLLSFERVSIDHEGCALLINKAEEIYRSCDDPNNLSYLDRLGDSSPLSSWGPKQLGIANEKLIWSLQSTGGVNGKASILTVFSRLSNRVVLTVSISDCYMNYGSVSSDGSLFLSGELEQSPKEGSQKGVILRSVDRGRTWHKIFETDEDVSYIQFIPPDASTIWVLQKNGKVVKLLRKISS